MIQLQEHNRAWQNWYYHLIQYSNSQQNNRINASENATTVKTAAFTLKITFQTCCSFVVLTWFILRMLKIFVYAAFRYGINKNDELHLPTEQTYLTTIDMQFKLPKDEWKHSYIRSCTARHLEGREFGWGYDIYMVCTAKRFWEVYIFKL